MDEVKQLERSLFKKTDVWGPEVCEQEMKKRNVRLVVAVFPSKAENCFSENNTSILGYAFLTFTSVNIHVSKIAVRESFRRLGIATGLMKESLKMATSGRRCLTASLHVNPGNTPAMNLYQSLGFKLDGQLEDYYGQGRPAFKMVLDLLDSSSWAQNDGRDK